MENKYSKLIILLCFNIVSKIALLIFPFKNKFGSFKMSNLFRACQSLGLESYQIIATVDFVSTMWQSMRQLPCPDTSPSFKPS